MKGGKGSTGDVAGSMNWGNKSLCKISVLEFGLGDICELSYNNLLCCDASTAR